MYGTVSCRPCIVVVNVTSREHIPLVNEYIGWLRSCYASLLKGEIKSTMLKPRSIYYKS